MKTWLHSVYIILHDLNGTLTLVPTRTKETELEIVGAGDGSIGSAAHGPQALSGLSLRPFIVSDRCVVRSMRWKSLREWGQCQIKSNQWSNKVKGLWKIGLLSGLDTCRDQWGECALCVRWSWFSLMYSQWEKMETELDTGRFWFPGSLRTIKCAFVTEHYCLCCCCEIVHIPSEYKMFSLWHHMRITGQYGSCLFFYNWKNVFVCHICILESESKYPSVC